MLCPGFVFLAACMVLLPVPSGLAQETNVTLANGSMEEMESDQLAAWSFYGGTGTEFTLSQETEDALVGNACAVIDATAAEITPNQFGNLSQTFDIRPWRGRTVRFRAALRVTEKSDKGRAQLWFRVDGKPAAQGHAETLTFDNMSNRPVLSNEWEYYEITGKIPEEAERLIVGTLAFASCKVWIDDVTLEIIEDSDEPTTAEAFPVVRTPGVSNDNSQQPFYNHWLWLVVITLTLFAISQLGRFGGVVDLQGQQVEYGWLRKFALRFSVVYWLLYCLPSPFTSLLFSWGMKLHVWYSGIVDKVVRWTASNILGIERELVPPGGSGDTTFDFVRLFVCFAVALAAALVWTGVDRRKTDYRWVNDLLRSYLRYVLAFAMLGYGLAKVGMSMNQFPEIGLSQLNKNWGDSSPMNVVWSMMGASRPYTIFAGLGEVAGGLLLLWRRTTLMGAMVTFGVMLNVVMLNFCYDIPVKQYSFHLLMMALFLALPETGRLANLLFRNRPTIAVRVDPPCKGKTLLWLHRAVKAYIIIVGAGLPLYNKIKAEIDYDPNRLGEPAWFGYYEVEEFTRNGQVVPPLLTDGSRWKSVTIQRYPWNRNGQPIPSDALAIVMMNGVFTGGMCTVSETDQTITCATVSPETLRVKTGGDDIVEFSGKSGSDEFLVRVRRVRREDYLLVNRGFRWINERPYNR